MKSSISACDNQKGPSFVVRQSGHGALLRHVETQVKITRQTILTAIAKNFASSLITLSTILLVLAITGCAGVPFKYSAVGSLELGKLQSSDYQNVFGKNPVSQKTLSTADGHYEIVVYNYATSQMGGPKVRGLTLEFKNGVLNAYQYTSMYKDDQTVVPVDNIEKIKSGTSTENDVLALLGKPYGKAKCPTTLKGFIPRCGKGSEVWYWGEVIPVTRIFGGNPFSWKSLFVIFDANGSVVGLELIQPTGVP